MSQRTRWLFAALVLSLIASFLYYTLRDGPTRDATLRRTNPRAALPSSPEQVQSDTVSTTHSDSTRGHVVTVQATNGTPVPDAQVLIACPDCDAFLPIGLTDSAGRVRAASVSLQCEHPTRTLVARHPGYETTTQSVLRSQLGTKSTVVLVLERASGLIRGRAVFTDGTPGPPGIVVFVWPSGRTPSRSALHRVELRHPLAPCALTDADGYFFIDGLDATAQYNLFAVGQGCFAEHALVRLRPDGDGAPLVELTVYALLGSPLQLEDTAGQPLEADSRLWSRGLTLPDPETGVALLETDFPIAAATLLGGLEWPSGSADTLSCVYWFIAQEPVSQAGPFTFGLSVPGYVPGEAPILAYSTGLAEIPVQHVQLRRIAQARSALAVEVTGLDDTLLDIQPMYGELYLFDSDHRMTLLELSGEPVTILDPVPVGEYRILFKASHGLYQVPEPGHESIYVNVSSANVGWGEFVMSNVGHIVMYTGNADGSAFMGDCYVRLRKNKRYGNPVYFSGGVGALHGVPEGGYELCWATRTGEGEEWQEERSEAIEVVEDDRLELELIRSPQD